MHPTIYMEKLCQASETLRDTDWNKSILHSHFIGMEAIKVHKACNIQHTASYITSIRVALDAHEIYMLSMLFVYEEHFTRQPKRKKDEWFGN